MKVFCVRIGDKYGVEYEHYINSKLSDYEVIWIREPYRDDVSLQWNKMLPMSMDIDEPVCVIDIDLLLINDYKQVFDYPISRGQFLTINDWVSANPDYPINGGFFKYYPTDTRYIFDKFMQDPVYWQNFYIAKGIARGPVNGEQHFVYDSAKEQLDVITLPPEWFTRWATTDSIRHVDYDVWQLSLTRSYRESTGNNYLFLGGDFHPDIKIVHFTHAMNKPHEWDYYESYKSL
jgi:hypothetical protein